MKTIVIAHRGASKDAPENTLSSIKKAVDLKVPLIECDIHLSKDLVPILIHDFTLERTTNAGKIKVSELTLKELKELDAGSWFSSTFKGEKIPTLEEVLQLTTKLIIEVKINRSQNHQILHPLLPLLRKYRGSFVGSFSSDFLKDVKEVAPDLPLVGICDKLSELEKHLSLGVKTISIDEKLVTKELVNSLKKAAVTLFTWTVDKPSRFHALADIGVDGIITNDPKLFIASH